MHAIELTDANFKGEVSASSIPVLVDFWAVWCAPCRMVAPVVEEIAGEFAGKLKVGKVDIDSNPNTAMEFQIKSIPTLLIFKEGKVVDQIVGAIPKKKLVEKIQSHLS